MPDARPPEAASAPSDDWGQVLAALPLESPPEGGWQRVAQRLPARRSPARVWVPAALAASLALLLLVPWKTQPPTTQVNPGVASSSQHDQHVERAPPPTVSAPPAAVDATDATQVAVAATETGERDVAASLPEPSVDAATQPRRSTTPHLLADTHKAATVTAPVASTDKKAATSPSQEDLYAESARLEALLAQIRDDRVSSGTAMALSAELHDRLGGIDAALSQPELEAGERLGLWRERVATLQRLTGVESTQRWMAANGYRADGQVAQIY
ncbi:MAG TPA: hypothetical protein VM469_03115 [Pseudoxanthomonas sp.]|nr:hypothetical protein [Pseudoxanthomonas sp.]